MNKSNAANAGLLNKATYFAVLQGPDSGSHIMCISFQACFHHVYQLSGMFPCSPHEISTWLKQHGLLMLSDTSGYPHNISMEYAM